MAEGRTQQRSVSLANTDVNTQASAKSGASLAEACRFDQDESVHEGQITGECTSRNPIMRQMSGKVKRTGNRVRKGHSSLRQQHPSEARLDKPKSQGGCRSSSGRGAGISLLQVPGCTPIALPGAPSPSRQGMYHRPKQERSAAGPRGREERGRGPPPSHR